MGAPIDQHTGKRVHYGHGRQALIEATVRLVARDGLSRLTTRTLLAEAQVSQGSLHHHFRSLQDVLGAALDHAADVSLAYLPMPAIPRAVFDGMLALFTERPEVSAFRTEMFLEGKRRPEVAALVRAHQARFEEVVRAMLAASGRAVDEGLVSFVAGAIDGFAYQAAVFGPEHLTVTKRQLDELRSLVEYLLVSEPSSERRHRRSTFVSEKEATTSAASANPAVTNAEAEADAR
ncbi:TetR/AcrR family transcriptional regulator [Microbacterium sp. NPDC077663]|uniref:TetR/AcrR family transcriptional regulator n=1 Tax=Microbacterium sp. NPDC077663 TaxID=3364189 RepID=UPI0037C7AFC1